MIARTRFRRTLGWGARRRALFAAALSTLAAPPLRADPPPSDSGAQATPSLTTTASGAGTFAGPISNVSQGTTRANTKATITIGGYVEAFYQWNFNDPRNDITNYRAFDDRHDTFSISNAVLDVLGAIGPVAAHLALQVGLTAETEYQDEPRRSGTNVVPPSSSAVWKNLQQANVGYVAPLGRGLLCEAGIFLSPVGPEGIAVKDQWNWSRSNLFFGLPFYHTGIRVTYPFTDRVSVSLQGYNGWNSVVDNNAEKSLAAQFTYNVPDRVTLNLLYFTGVERDDAAPEGRPWRHLFDAWAAYYPRRWLSLLAHADAGFEPNFFGTSWWAAGALYARAQPLRWLYVAARGDWFYEHKGNGASGTASPIFWPVDWVASATGTLDFRPADNISLRIEYRHDQAQNPIYFRGTVPIVIQTGAFVPNAASQDTLTIGATTWF